MFTFYWENGDFFRALTFGDSYCIASLLALLNSPYPNRHFQLSDFNLSPSTFLLQPFSFNLSHCDTSPIKISTQLTHDPIKMPTEQEFEAFDAYLDSADPYMAKELLEQNWPEPDDQLAYAVWKTPRILAENRRAKEEARLRSPSPPFVPQGLLQMISATNFNIASELDALEEEICGASDKYLPLGVDVNGEQYRIRIDIDALVCRSRTKISRPLHPEYLLGVNTHIPLHHGQAHVKESSEESNISNESDFLDTKGCVCLQLGEVMVHLTTDLQESLPYGRTGFAAVVRITRTGRADGIYLLYDFYQRDDETDFNLEREVRTDGRWGILGDRTSDDRFSFAKVADAADIPNLSLDFKLQLSDISKHEVQIVRVVQAANGTLIPAEIPSSVLGVAKL